MTDKQTLVAELNILRAAVDGLPPLTEKRVAKMSIGVVRLNIELYRKQG